MRTLAMVIGGMASLGGLYWAWEWSRLSKHRGLSQQEFVSYFSQYEVTPELSAGIYDHFKRMRGVKGFCPAPNDTIEVTYGMLNDDLDDELRDILGRFGSEMPSRVTLAEWQASVNTLEGVVRLVDWVLKGQNSSFKAS